MKRIQLIETGILTVTLVFGYKFIDSIISTIITILFQFSYRDSNTLSFLLEYIIFSVFYFVALFLLVKYNKQLAAYIDKQGQPGPEAGPEIINIRLEQGSLLFIVLVALCLTTLLGEIPVIILSIYNYFKKEAGGIRSGNIEDLKFKSSAIQFTFSLIVLFYAKKISAWFNKESPSEKPLAETTNEL